MTEDDFSIPASFVVEFVEEVPSSMKDFSIRASVECVTSASVVVENVVKFDSASSVIDVDIVVGVVFPSSMIEDELSISTLFVVEFVIEFDSPSSTIVEDFSTSALVVVEFVVKIDSISSMFEGKFTVTIWGALVCMELIVESVGSAGRIVLDSVVVEVKSSSSMTEVDFSVTNLVVGEFVVELESASSMAKVGFSVPALVVEKFVVERTVALEVKSQTLKI